MYFCIYQVLLLECLIIKLISSLSLLMKIISSIIVLQFPSELHTYMYSGMKHICYKIDYLFKPLPFTWLHEVHFTLYFFNADMKCYIIKVNLLCNNVCICFILLVIHYHTPYSSFLKCINHVLYLYYQLTV